MHAEMDNALWTKVHNTYLNFPTNQRSLRHASVQFPFLLQDTKRARLNDDADIKTFVSDVNSVSLASQYWEWNVLGQSQIGKTNHVDKVTSGLGLFLRRSGRLVHWNIVRLCLGVQYGGVEELIIQHYQSLGAEAGRMQRIGNTN